jgi:plasmid maintenance system antidote protein VapI
VFSVGGGTGCESQNLIRNSEWSSRNQPEDAGGLSIAFGTSAESWLSQQMQYDLWHAEQRCKKLRVRKLAA